MTVRMVDIGEKEDVERTATARGRIELAAETVRAVREERVKKGDVRSAAQISGILTAKKAPDIIPLCHPIPITNVVVDIEAGTSAIDVECTVRAKYKTGVEMEALAGVMGALLTVWDMVKYLEKDENGQYPRTRITNVRVISKRKG